MLTKSGIRKKYKEIRNALPEDVRAEKSRRICDHIIASCEYKKAKYIFAYHPLGSEADIRYVIKTALKDGKITALPRVKGDGMDFYVISGLDELLKGSFGVMEPDADICPLILPAGRSPEPDTKYRVPAMTAAAGEILVTVPGLAFDLSGNRMGYGGGYYDKYFSRAKGAVLAAACYEEQIAGSVLTQEHDIKMDLIFTERGSYRI